VSTKRTLVRLLTVESIARAEGANLGLHASLLRLEARELVAAPGERAQELGNESAYRAAALGGADASTPVHIVGNCNGDVLHASRPTTVSQKL
jgi:hypothetical protein